MRFNKDNVVCAKYPGECKKCDSRKDCEVMILYYYTFIGLKECFSNNEKT